MKAEIKPTEDQEKLAENLDKRVKSLEIEGETIKVETESREVLEKVPGIKSFEINGEKHMGIGGSPIEEQVYARIESKEDAVRCLLATVEGYSVAILNTEREWDLRKLKKFNPDIKHLKFDEPVKELGIEKALFESDKLEKVEIEMPGDEELLKIYREMLT